MATQTMEYHEASVPTHGDGKPAGRFDLAAMPRTPGLRDTLVTSLLVLLPTLATVAAIVAGLVLTGGTGI